MYMGLKSGVEVIPALLQHLAIQHVSVACHSAGTVSALDIVLHFPEILHPERPYLAIGGPWILPKHTGSTALHIAHSLPTSVLNQTDKAARLINNHIGPAVGASFGVSYKLAAKIRPARPAKPSTDANDREGARLEAQMWPHVIERIYAEGVKGLSTDAVLMMQKGMTGWSDWGDYDTGIPRLAELLRADGKRLTVDVFFAEEDIVIGDGGTKGPRWFDKCWAPHGDVFEYRSSTVKGTDHDAIWNLKWGVAQTVFQRVGTEQNVEAA
jgi:pimeloyl-ACP methyl ester carboxylesterase